MSTRVPYKSLNTVLAVLISVVYLPIFELMMIIVGVYSQAEIMKIALCPVYLLFFVASIGVMLGLSSVIKRGINCYDGSEYRMDSCNKIAKMAATLNAVLPTILAVFHPFVFNLACKITGGHSCGSYVFRGTFGSFGITAIFFYIIWTEKFEENIQWLPFRNKNDI